MKKMENKKAVFVLGPPNSGKGTQAKLLAEKLGFYHFITSREGMNYIVAHRDDPETLKQEENYKAGILYEPPWLVERVLKERTQDIFETDDGIIYDGSPRTLYEAEKLFEFLSELIGKGNVFVIEIDVSEEELRRRVAKRLICFQDSAHVFICSEIIRAGDRCPECGGILGQRDLDKDDIFVVRIFQYRERTVPGLDYLKKNHSVTTVNGEGKIEEIFEEIFRIFESVAL